MKLQPKIIAGKAAFAVALTALFSMAPARADTVLSIQSVTASPGTSGTFDVLLTNTGPSALNVASFSFGLTTANTDITFNGATTSTTTAPYVFPASAFGPNIATTSGAQTVEASDFDATFLGTNLAAGQTVGLGNVAFSVAGGAPNEVANVSFEAFPTASLGDANFDNVPIDAMTPGSITVSTTITPEPDMAWPLGALAIGLIGFCWKRKRAILTERAE